MDSYKLRDIGATVSTFGDEYQTFSDVLNDMIKIDPRLDINDVQDLVDTLGGGMKTSKRVQKNFA